MVPYALVISYVHLPIFTICKSIPPVFAITSIRYPAMHFFLKKMTYILQIAILCLKLLKLALHIYNCFYLDGVLVAEMVETLEFDNLCA